MVRKFSMALLSGVVMLTSCSNDVEQLKGEYETGSLELAFSFEAPSVSTKAYSNAKPSTSWAQIKNVDVFFCDASDNIIVAKQIQGSQFAGAGPIGTSQKIKFKDLKVGNYRVYAFANASDAEMVPFPAKQGSAPLWSTGAVEGKKIDDVYMMLKAAGQETVGATQQNLYNKACNLFEAKTTANIESGKDVQVNLPLTRQVALLRIRVNQNGYTTSFTDATSFVKIMDNPLQVSALGSRLNSFVDKSVIKEIAGFRTQNPSVGDGYVAGGTIVDAQHTQWLDIIVPAASRANNLSGFKRPFIVLKGKKNTENRYYGFYLPLLPDNTWTYTKENTIYDLSVKLTSDGSKVEPEIPTPVGNVDLNVSVMDWGSVDGYETEI
ncbi:MAG: FimB/Mfa2 family fimbrial subunit [Bacteroidales bacterium]